MSRTIKKTNKQKKNTDKIDFNERVYLRRNKKRMEKSLSHNSPNSMLEIVFDVFIEYLTEGNPVDVVCDLVGIGYTTYSKWIKRGEMYEEQVLIGMHNPMDETCYLFNRQVRKAIASNKRTHVLRINSNSVKYDWKQSLAILERRDRANWGRDIIAVSKELYDPDETFL